MSGVARSLRLRCRSTADGCHDLVAPVGGVWACPSSVDGGVVSRPFAGSYLKAGMGFGSHLPQGVELPWMGLVVLLAAISLRELNCLGRDG